MIANGDTLLNLFDDHVTRENFNFGTSMCLTMQTARNLRLGGVEHLAREVKIPHGVLMAITNAYSYAPDGFPFTDYDTCREVARRILEGQDTEEAFKAWENDPEGFIPTVLEDA